MYVWISFYNRLRVIPLLYFMLHNKLYIHRFRKIFPQGVRSLRADIETVKTLLENIGSPVVFCHNDLLLTNILVQSDNSVGGSPVSVAIIDYEYAMFNYYAFDIANHFIEFAGVYYILHWNYFSYFFRQWQIS